MGQATVLFDDGRVAVTRLVVGRDNNVYVVRCQQTGKAVLVDAADQPEELLALCQRLGVEKVIETHGHWDHIRAVPGLRENGYKVGVAAEDAAMLPGYDFLVHDEDVIEVGALRLRAMHTPGHTPGSTCFVTEGSPVLLSGDTLFPGGPGATRWPYSDFEAIIRSIDERLFPLPAETVVLPGHGAETTIGAERPHLQEWADRGW